MQGQARNGVIVKDMSYGHTGSLNLVCFHHCGGDASLWREAAQSLVDFKLYAVILPGRSKSKKNELVCSMDELADGALSALTVIAGEIPEFCSRPTVFMGHSMGGILAYETLLRLTDMNTERPDPLLKVHHLIISSVRSPDKLTNKNMLSKAYPEGHSDWLVHLRSEEGLMDHVRSIGGAAAVDERFVRAKLHAIRGDFAAFETYTSCNVIGQRVRAVPCEITCFYGTQDEKVPRLEVLDWDRFTMNSFHFTQFFGGGHFYLNSSAHKSAFAQRVKLIGDRILAECRLDALSPECSSITQAFRTGSTRTHIPFPSMQPGMDVVNNAGDHVHCMPLGPGAAPPGIMDAMMPPASPDPQGCSSGVVLTTGSVSPMSPHVSIVKPIVLSRPVFTHPRGAESTAC